MRVSWDEVLSSVPQQFGVGDILKHHPGARAKGRAQIYNAVNRWLADKKVKRVGFGRYEKVGGAARVSAARPKVARKARGRRAAGAKRAVLKRAAARRSKRSKRKA